MNQVSKKLSLTKQHVPLILVILIVLVSGALSLLGFRWWFLRRHPALHLEVIPLRLNMPHIPGDQATNWTSHTFDSLVFKIPSSWQEIPMKKESVKWKVWGNKDIALLARTPEKIDFSRYRKALYAQWHPARLMQKTIAIPVMDKENPRIIEQQIGPWRAFIFPSSTEWHFDLFQDGTSVIVVFRVQRERVSLDEQLMKDIVATVRISRDASPHDY